MNMNAIKTIYKFNKDAGLLEKGYDDFLESSFQIEEALEGFNLDGLYRTILDGEKTEPSQVPTDNSPKNISRAMVALAMEEYEPISDVDRLDKALDAIVFAFGSIFKLGLTSQQSMKALQIVMDANMSKLSAGKDEYGKQMKPKDFVGPESALQKILDEREAK